MCRFLDGALSTSHLTKIRAVPPTRNYKSTCRFVAAYGVARLEVGVYPASDPGAATIDIEGATERKAVYLGAQ